MSGAESTQRCAPPATLGDGTVLRPLSRREEMEACVDLQRRVWGEDFADVASPAILQIVQAVGGVAAGAFGDRNALLGFVFGVTGIRDGRPLHWSHMLAVLPEARGRDLGFHLKAYQRRILLSLGIDTVQWTYDPLVSKNAYLNLVRLGARVDRYLRDYYGSGQDSALSAGIGTDRFVVEWRIREDRVERALTRPESRHGGPSPDEIEGAPVVNARPAAGGGGRPEPVTDGPLSDAPAVRVEIPHDVLAVRRTAPGEAALWRASTRRALESYLARGYAVETVHRSPGQETEAARSFYVLRSNP